MDRLSATKRSRYTAELYDDRDYRHPAMETPRDFRTDALAFGRRPDAWKDRPDWDRRDDYERYRRRSPSPGRRYHDRDRSPVHESHRSSPPRGRVSRTIILEGVPLDMTQEDIFAELQKHFHCDGLEHVKLIRDKRTGISRRFAFAQFAAVDHAKNFLDRYAPRLRFYDPADSSSTDVKIAFSRDKEDRERPQPFEDEWMCDVCSGVNFPQRSHCFRCNAPKTRAVVSGVMAPASMALSGMAITGDSDVSFDNVASQFLLFRGLEPGVSEALLAKGVAKLFKSDTEPPPKKGKIASTTDNNPGARPGSLRRVLLVRDRRSDESWRYGFAEFATVDDASAALAKFSAADKFTISSKPVMVSYIHTGVFVPALDDLDPKYTFAAPFNPAMMLKYWDEGAYVSYLVVSKEEVEPVDVVDAKPETKPIEKTKKRKADRDAGGRKPAAPHLQFWSDRHAEIHGIESNTVEPVHSDTSAQSYIDRTRNCCLLCSRQFKSEAEANKHERLSSLHQTNLGNEDLKKRAIMKLSKAAPTEDAYRDRAKERRHQYQQSKQPKAEKPPATPHTPDPVPSKGAGLLRKMGWTSGDGLGATGTGRTEAITTTAYAAGVGLGAVGGKLGDATAEANRQTRGSYADFVNQTRERAKERYERME